MSRIQKTPDFRLPDGPKQNESALDGDSRKVGSKVQYYWGGHWLDFKFDPTQKWEKGKHYAWHGKDRTTYRGWHEEGKGHPGKQKDWELANPKLAEKLHEVRTGFQWDPTVGVFAKSSGERFIYSWDSTHGWREATGDVTEAVQIQVDWEELHPKEAAELHRRGKPRLQHRMKEMQEKSMLQRERESRRPRVETNDERNIRILMQGSLGSYMRFIQRLVKIQFERERNGALPMPMGNYGGASKSNGKQISKVGIPTMYEVIPQKKSSGGSDSYTGPDLVGRWIKYVDRKWDAVMGNRR